MHRRALEREAQLKAEVDRLQALLRLREQQLFGRKTETAAATEPAAPLATPTGRRRGGRAASNRGQPGPKRRDYSHLPAVLEDHELPPEQCRCSRCGQPFDDFPGTEDSIILEVEVRAHRRVIRRRRYRPTCSCAAHPGIVTAPPPPRLIPKSILGVSIWVALLLDKYLFYRPTYRLLADWATHGLDLSLGTVTDGLRHLVPLFEPVYEALVRRSQGQTLWHADETRWLVFASIEGKVGYRWYLWVFHSAEVVVFVLAAGRSHDVPEEHFGPVEGRGILVVDRYKAYQAIDKVKSGLIVLAFCWAHVRRDFLRVARSWPDQEGWALDWVAQIGTLYHLNDERLKVRHDAAAFAVADGALRAAVTSVRGTWPGGTAGSGRPSGAAEGAGEPGGSLDGLDGVRRAPRGADGQQHGRAFGTWPGGGSEELLRQRLGVERPVGGDAVLAVPDAVPVGSEPPAVADGVPDRVRGSRGPGAGGRGPLPAVEPQPGATPRVGQRGGGPRRRTRRNSTRKPRSKGLKSWSLQRAQFGGPSRPCQTWETGLPNTYQFDALSLYYRWRCDIMVLKMSLVIGQHGNRSVHFTIEGVVRRRCAEGDVLAATAARPSRTGRPAWQCGSDSRGWPACSRPRRGSQRGRSTGTASPRFRCEYHRRRCYHFRLRKRLARCRHW